jgi:hypothetical protein
MKTISRLDAYPKHVEDFRVRTSSGAIVSLIALVVITVLVASEFNYYLESHTTYSMAVDVAAHETIKLDVDIAFPFVPCKLLSVDLRDTLGERVGIGDYATKTPQFKDGTKGKPGYGRAVPVSSQDALVKFHNRML